MHTHHCECEARLRMSGGLCAALLVTGDTQEVMPTRSTLTASFQSEMSSQIYICSKCEIILGSFVD